MNFGTRKTGLIAIAMVITCITIASSKLNAQMVIESLGGPVTETEIGKFKSYITSLTLPTLASSNSSDLPFGTTGFKRVLPMGVMYLMTGDREILDVMLKWTDRILSMRNDSVSGNFDWTGNRELIWYPQDVRTHAEQGQTASHISFAARLILQNPSLWTQTVASGDPYSYGATYKKRAERYVHEMNKTEENYLMKWLVRSSDSLYYFTTDPRYDGGSNGKAIPFNQQWMMSFNKIQLAKCCEILGDTDRAKKYSRIVQKNFDWYTSEFENTTYDGHPASKWYYDPITHSQLEDQGHGHARHGVLGMFHMDAIGGYANFPERLLMGNAFQHAVYKPATGQWGWKVNGSGELNDDINDPSYILLSQWVPSLYELIANDQMKNVKNRPDVVAYILWTKNARFKGEWTTITSMPEMLAEIPGTENKTFSYKTYVNENGEILLPSGSLNFSKSVSVYDFTGRLVQKKDIAVNKLRMEVNSRNLPGLYIIRITKN